MESKLKTLKKGDKLQIINPHTKKTKDCVFITKTKNFCFLSYKPNQHVLHKWVCNEYLSV